MVLNVVFKKKSQSPNGFMFNLVSLKTGSFVAATFNIHFPVSALKYFSPACNL